MIYFIGDSNLRGSIEDNQALVGTLFNDPPIFEQAGSNEAVKATLETIEEIGRYSQIYIGTLLNEITVKGKVAKTRDEVIAQVTKSQADIIQSFASINPKTEFLIIPPFLRMEPPWMVDKLRMIYLSLKDHIEQIGLKNVRYLKQCNIVEEDLVSDKIHLTEKGKIKLLESITTKENSEQASMDWASQSQTPAAAAKTPRFNLRSLNKRTRGGSDSDEEVSKKKGKTDLETILAKLTSLSDEMKDERAAAAEKTESIIAKLNINIQSTSNNKIKLDKLEEKQIKTDLTIAKLKEDLDAVENENQKNIVLVRRLKAATRVSNNKAELNEILKRIADELLVEVGTPVGRIKFVTLAYTTPDPVKQATRPGQVPAFKIGFKDKDDAIAFREKAAKLAKDPKHRLHKAGFSYQQCAGTRIRSSILWLIAAKLKAEDKECWVNSNSNKPKLNVKSGERYPREYSYTDAIETYRDKLTEDDLKEITGQARKLFKGQCAQIFGILKD
jgi:hypothetical protein